MSIKKFLPFIAILLMFCMACKSPQKTVSFTKKSLFLRSEITEVTQKQLDADGLLIDAVIQSELGNVQNAFNLFNQVLAMDSSYAAAHFQLANIYFLRGDVKKAISENQKAISIEPQNTWYQAQLAVIYTQSRQLDKAAKTYQKIVEDSPEILEYYDEWARVLLMDGQAEDAIKVYNLLEKRIGITEEVSLQKQRVWQVLGKEDKAIAEVEKLSKANPSETKYNAILAEIYMSKKEYSKALPYYGRIKAADPHDKYIDVSLAEYYQKTNNPQKAYESLKSGFQNLALDIESKLQILVSFYSMDDFYGKYQKYAYDLTKTLAELYPDNAQVLPIYADFLMKDKHTYEAFTYFKKSITLDSTRYEVWQALLFTESELGNDSLLLLDSRKTTELFPTQPLPYYFYGMSLLSKKQYKEALEVFKIGEKWIVDNDELLAEFYAGIGEAHHREKLYTESDKYFKKALDLRPDNYYVLNNFAYYLSERKENLEQAEKMSKRTIEKFPDEPTYLDTYAWILFEMGHYKDALVYIEKAIKNDSDPSGVVLEHYGDILYKNDQAEKAREYWEKALEKGDASEKIDIKVTTGKIE